ncbi:hypothetical protein [Guptibacillus hwajinpoensis]|uniref:hypothetical protein n=1 Tax=Guptibacillus hwajinpoensis TaxID=208199 RepID=UPI001CFC72FD|nr:hypothetical protein [Pseudalkalibacillus hwajinpoensis]WLR60173.1 hypothetical protein LC071_01915 [Pseudalkalibacillus hwajinpoensis]
MAGNEISAIRYLWRNLNHISLDHIGIVNQIGAPNSSAYGFDTIHSEEELVEKIKTQSANKKADVYLNGEGISLKQSGGSFSFNRIVRDKLLSLFQSVNISDPNRIVQLLDEEIVQFHQGMINTRNRDWRNFFSEQDFKNLTHYLMMISGQGSPSLHPANYILEVNRIISDDSDFKMWNFEDYFNEYKDRLSISIRRQWIGQNSHSESTRAVSIARRANNLPWVFDDVSGEPRTGWNSEVSEEERKTVYFIMIEKK